MASRETSRKKRKVSHTSGLTPAPTTMPTVASSSALPVPSSTTIGTAKNIPAATPCHHETSLKALNTDLDAMRQLVTCKICDRLLYEPYALSCGHTYCYSCLSQWLGSNSRMTCPDCRTVIKQQPTPSYLIRELVLIFVSRNELLPDGETADEHNKLVRDEGELVAKDKANTDPRTGGLFKGRFNRSRMDYLAPLHDSIDGVDRCPACQWELEEGHCEQCGYEADDMDDDFSDTEFSEMLSDEEVDMELRDMDGYGSADPELMGENALAAQHFRERVRNGVHTGPRRWADYRRPGHPQGPIDLLSSDDEEDNESGEDEYDANDTFINDETIVEDDASASDEGSDATIGRANEIRRVQRVVIADDESEEDEDDVQVVRSRHLHRRLSDQPARRRRAPIAISDDEDDEDEEIAPSTTQGADELSSSTDSEDEEPVWAGSQRTKRPAVALRSRRAMTATSDEESSVGDYGNDEVTARGGFSPLDEGFGDLHEEDEDEEQYAADEFGGMPGLATDSFGPDDASVGADYEQSDDGYSDQF